MKKKITTEEFDRRFEAGEDISDFVDWKAARLGVSRQALIKFVMSAHLKNS